MHNQYKKLTLIELSKFARMQNIKFKRTTICKIEDAMEIKILNDVIIDKKKYKAVSIIDIQKSKQKVLEIHKLSEEQKNDIIFELYQIEDLMLDYRMFTDEEKTKDVDTYKKIKINFTNLLKKYKNKYDIKEKQLNIIHFTQYIQINNYQIEKKDFFQFALSLSKI